MTISNPSLVSVKYPQERLPFYLLIPPIYPAGTAAHWALEVLTAHYNAFHRLCGLNRKELRDRILRPMDADQIYQDGLIELILDGLVEVGHGGFVFPTDRLRCAYGIPDTLYDVQIDGVTL